MIESRVYNLYAPAAPACWRTTLQTEKRRSECVTLHLGRKNYFHGSLSRTQRISGCKLQISCNSLRLGAAEEGERSWEDTLIGKGHLLEGESDGGWRDRIVDKEGNINNMEQEQTCEEEAGSEEQWQADEGACPDDLIRPDDISTRGQDQVLHPQLSEARFTSTSLSSSSNLWPGEDGIQEGHQGEAIVDNVHVFPSHRQGEGSPAQFREHEKYGTSESNCDKGSLSRADLHVYGGGNALQKGRLQEDEEKVFQVDDGRTPDDYQRRANLFGKSGEQFVAQKQRNERKNM